MTKGLIEAFRLWLSGYQRPVAMMTRPYGKSPAALPDRAVSVAELADRFCRERPQFSHCRAEVIALAASSGKHGMILIDVQLWGDQAMAG